LRRLKFANERQEGDGDVRSIDAGSPPTPMPACAKAARSRDTHGARGQWGDPVAEILTGGAVGLAARRTARWHRARPGREVEPHG